MARTILRTMALTVLLVQASAQSDPPKPVLRPPRHGGVYVVAHRGAHQGIPENTLAAYRKAIELGVDFVEIDLRTTKDGKFVSIHNGTVDAYMSDGKTGKVRDFTLAELRALDIGSRVGPEWKAERIPTFEEILDLCKGKCGIYLDLKDAAIDPLAKQIKIRGMERDVIWYASNKKLQYLQKHHPKFIPMPDPGPEKNIERVVGLLKPKIIAPVWRNYSASYVQTCHDAGALVIVDESGPSCWEDALAWGSDGVQTDHPAKFIEFLKARKTPR